MTIPGGPAPFDEATVLGPEWLTAVLQPRFPGVVVASTSVSERLETVATKVRFHVEYATHVEGAPHDLCAKGYFNPAMQSRAAGTQAETIFYRELAAGVPVNTPPCLHAGIDGDTGHGLILMEDLKAAGATFLDPMADYGPDQAAATLEQLAVLHASYWSQGDAAALEPFSPRLPWLVGYMEPDVLQGQLDDGRAEGVAADVLRADRLLDAMLAMGKVGDAGPITLVHGDVHTGNIYLLPDGTPGIIDWQVAQRGLWALDVAYHVAAVLEPDDRERAERDLVDHYLSSLAAAGVTPPDRDAAWLAYRLHLPYGFFMWGITRAVARPIVERFTSRLGRAVAFHGSFDLLDV